MMCADSPQAVAHPGVQTPVCLHPLEPMAGRDATACGSPRPGPLSAIGAALSLRLSAMHAALSLRLSAMHAALSLRLSCGHSPASRTRRVWMFLALLVCLGFGSGIAARAQNAPPARDPAEMKSRLHKILAGPEFQPETHEENAMSRFFKWLGDQWDAFWKRLRKALGLDRPRRQQQMESMGSTGTALVWTLVYAFLAAGLVLLAYLIRGAILRYLDSRDAKKSKKKQNTAFDIDSAEADMVTEPDVWVQQAQEFAKGGDYRRAIRALFLAILLQLDQAGAIEYERYRTNGDYLRLLRNKGYDTLVKAFRPFVLDFEVRWYGDRVTAENDYRNCLTEYERLRDMIPMLGSSAPASAAATPGRA